MRDSPSPLDVLLAAMRQRLSEQNITAAVQIARLAAPYLHPKATHQMAHGDIAKLTDEQLDELRGHSQPGVGIAPGDPEQPAGVVAACIGTEGACAG